MNKDTESNIDIVKYIVENTWRTQATEKLTSIVTAKSIINSPISSIKGCGLEALKKVSLYWKGAFPDLKSEWDSCDEVEPGKVVVKWHAIGTHTGAAFEGVATSDNTVEYSGVTTYEIQNGQLLRYEAKVDIDAIKNQLTKSVNLHEVESI